MTNIILAGIIAVLMVGFLIFWGPLALLTAMAMLLFFYVIVAANYQTKEV